MQPFIEPNPSKLYPLVHWPLMEQIYFLVYIVYYRPFDPSFYSLNNLSLSVPPVKWFSVSSPSLLVSSRLSAHLHEGPPNWSYDFRSDPHSIQWHYHFPLVCHKDSLGCVVMASLPVTGFAWAGGVKVGGICG